MTGYQEPQGSVMRREGTVTTAPNLASTSRGMIVTNEESQERANMRAECKEQSEKLLSNSEKRDYLKQCMSDKLRSSKQSDAVGHLEK
jgi:pantothenate synthetase